MTSKQIVLSIIMDAIDAKCKNLALLYKYNNRARNTISIEPIENVSNLIKDIVDNYNDDLYNEKDKIKILSIVPFTDGYEDEDPDTTLFYFEIIEGLKENIIEGD